MNPKFSLSILLALAVLLAPTSDAMPCTMIYEPVCCWKSTAAGPPVTAPNECFCKAEGGFVIIPRPCGPSRVPAAGAFARMPVAAPVAPSVARAESAPDAVCCFTSYAGFSVLSLTACRGTSGRIINIPAQNCPVSW